MADQAASRWMNESIRRKRLPRSFVPATDVGLQNAILVAVPVPEKVSRSSDELEGFLRYHFLMRTRAVHR